MSYSTQGSSSKDEHLQSVKPVGKGGRGEVNPQRHQQLQSSATGVPSEDHIRRTNYSDKQSKHQQQQQSGIPSSSGGPQKNPNPENRQGTNNNSSLSGYQDLKPQQPPPVTVPSQGFHSRANALSNHESSTSSQPNEQVAPIQSPRQQNLRKSDQSFIMVPEEQLGIPSSSGFPQKSTDPAFIRKISEYSLQQRPRLRPTQSHEEVAPIQAPPQQNLPEDTRKEQTSKGYSVQTKKDFPEKINPTPSEEQKFSGAQNQEKQKPISEEKKPREPLPVPEQNQEKQQPIPGEKQPREPLPVPEQNQVKQQPIPGEKKPREPLPVPEGYPPHRPPTSSSKLEPPIVQPSKPCPCCSIL